jgi:hypothetical protein
LKSSDHSSIGIVKLGFVWDCETIESIFCTVFNLMTENAEDYSFSEDRINDFFYFDNNEIFKLKAKKFLFNYSKENIKNTTKINLVIDIMLHSMREYYEEYILFVLDLNCDVTFFSKIYWRGQSTFGMGDVILEEIDASDWRNILSVVDKSEPGIKLIPIKRYIKDMIDSCTRSADKRRREQFLYQY